MTTLARQASIDKALAALEAMGESFDDDGELPTVSVPMLAINKYLTCTFCGGYFRNAHTFKECQHTFCKWCLMRHFDDGGTSCPKAGCRTTFIGSSWSNSVAVDAQKQRLVDLLTKVAGADVQPVLPRPTIRPVETTKRRSRPTSSATRPDTGKSVPAKSLSRSRTHVAATHVTNLDAGFAAPASKRPRRAADEGASASLSTSTLTAPSVRSFDSEATQIKVDPSIRPRRGAAQSARAAILCQAFD